MRQVPIKSRGVLPMPSIRGLPFIHHCGSVVPLPFSCICASLSVLDLNISGVMSSCFICNLQLTLSLRKRTDYITIVLRTMTVAHLCLGAVLAVLLLLCLHPHAIRWACCASHMSTSCSSGLMANYAYLKSVAYEQGGNDKTVVK